MARKITRIEPLPKLAPFRQRQRRVAIYARVSTGSDEQLNSVEAQKAYYLNYVSQRPEWRLYQLYSDEGVSGTSNKSRDEFNCMIADALAGKFDLIITKSISRFARNTVDSLTFIRKLKAQGVEVYFEKEDVWTFDSKGEFIITLLSSFAQEESRSISENITWGQRKRFADGRYHMPYARFLGYEQGPHGKIIVNQREAAVVRLIYKLFLEGKSAAGVCRYLDRAGIPTPGGKQSWSQSTVNSILQNVKYKGDALLQQSFTVDFLTKKKKSNEGELPKYYVSGGHPAIIPPATFDYTQEMLRQRKQTPYFSGTETYCSKIVCAECGAFYGPKQWHSTTTHDKVWQCGRLYAQSTKCPAPYIYDVFLQYACKKALCFFLKRHAALLDTLPRLISSAIADDDALGSKDQRIKAIAGYLSRVGSRGFSSVTTSDEVTSVLLEKVVAGADKTLVFHFIDGTQYAFGLRLHHMDSLREFRKHNGSLRIR